MYNRDVSYFAKTNFRDEHKVFGIKQADRRFHFLICGKSGTGKSNLLKNFIYQDILHGRGICVFDIHNDIIPDIKRYIPEHRLHDVIELDIGDVNMPYRYNPLKRVTYEKRSLVASGILETFQKLWKSAWGVKLEHILRYILLTLLDQPHSTFADIPKIIHDETFRNQCLQHIVQEDVKNFWIQEFPKYTKNDVVPVLNKIGAFLGHPAIKRFLVENKEEISFRRIMDSNKVLLININKGLLGSDVAHILSSLLLTSIANAGFSRSDMPAEEREKNVFHLYLDEFQNYTSLSIVNLLSEIKKYSITVMAVTQSLQIIDSDIRNGVLGNISNLIVFRVGLPDAKFFAHELYPYFKSEDIINLPNYDIYLKLMIDGKISKSFSATTIRYFDYF